MGIVSLGPVRRRLRGLRGGVMGSKPRECLSIILSLEEASGLTTTMGGAGDARSGAAYLRSAFRGAVEPDEPGREEGRVPLVPGTAWLLLLLARWLRLARAEEG